MLRRDEEDLMSKKLQENEQMTKRMQEREAELESEKESLSVMISAKEAELDHRVEESEAAARKEVAAVRTQLAALRIEVGAALRSEQEVRKQLEKVQSTTTSEIASIQQELSTMLDARAKEKYERECMTALYNMEVRSSVAACMDALVTSTVSAIQSQKHQPHKQQQVLPAPVQPDQHTMCAETVGVVLTPPLEKQQPGPVPAPVAQAPPCVTRTDSGGGLDELARIRAQLLPKRAEAVQATIRMRPSWHTHQHLKAAMLQRGGIGDLVESLRAEVGGFQAEMGTRDAHSQDLQAQVRALCHSPALERPTAGRSVVAPAAGAGAGAAGRPWAAHGGELGRLKQMRMGRKSQPKPAALRANQ
jgi:hypothetical protein